LRVSNDDQSQAVPVTSTDVAHGSLRFAGGRLGFLLIHGLGGTPTEMRFVAQGLACAGYTVHVPRLAGHCGTVDDLRATGWPDWCASIEEEHNRLKQYCDLIVVGGLSMGAILAVHHASHHSDDVFALALYAPTLQLDGWGIPWYSRLFDMVHHKWFADLFQFAERDPWGIKDRRLRELVKTAIISGDASKAGIAALPGSLMLELRWLVDDIKKRTGGVRQPTLVVHPREDDRASLDNMMYFQSNLAGLVETVVLNDSYHIVTLDRQRQLVIDRTLDFVTRVQDCTETTTHEDVSEWLKPEL
jgi:carboxylesterase